MEEEEERSRRALREEEEGENRRIKFLYELLKKTTFRSILIIHDAIIALLPEYVLNLQEIVLLKN